MVDTLEHLEWDSVFLGYPVGRIGLGEGEGMYLPNMVRQARAAGYRLLYVFSQPTDLISQDKIEEEGGRLVDRKVTYLQEIKRAPEAVADSAVREVRSVSPQLRSLALQSGEYSRFRRDPNFGRHVYEQLYSQWIEKSIAGTLARTVFAYQPAEEELGLLTLGTKQQRADIGLLAVDETARGNSVGQRLVAVAKHRAYEWGLQELQVVTQLDNEPGCRFYEKCGFRPASLEYVYHLWLA